MVPRDGKNIGDSPGFGTISLVLFSESSFHLEVSGAIYWAAHRFLPPWWVHGFSTNPPPKMPRHPGAYLLKCFNAVWSVFFWGGPEYQTFSAGVSGCLGIPCVSRSNFFIPDSLFQQISNVQIVMWGEVPMQDSSHLLPRVLLAKTTSTSSDFRTFWSSICHGVMGNPTLETATRRFSFR